MAARAQSVILSVGRQAFVSMLASQITLDFTKIHDTIGQNRRATGKEPLMSSKRAINLARVSTPKQAELYSLDYQLEQERTYDAEMGFIVVAEFKDDVSGRKMERDGLE